MTKADASNRSAWVWTIIKGLVALALGIFLLVGADTASSVVAYALAGYLAISGAMQTFSGFFNRNAPGSATDRIRGLVGLVAGVVLLLLIYFNVLSLQAVYSVLAVAVIAYGLLGLFEAIFDRGASRFQWMPLIVNLLLVVLGAMVFYFRTQELDLKTWTGVVLAAIGLLIIVYGYFVQKSSPSAAAASV